MAPDTLPYRLCVDKKGQTPLHLWPSHWVLWPLQVPLNDFRQCRRTLLRAQQSCISHQAPTQQQHSSAHLSLSCLRTHPRRSMAQIRAGSTWAARPRPSGHGCRRHPTAWTPLQPHRHTPLRLQSLKGKLCRAALTVSSMLSPNRNIQPSSMSYTFLHLQHHAKLGASVLIWQDCTLTPGHARFPDVYPSCRCVQTIVRWNSTH